MEAFLLAIYFAALAFVASQLLVPKPKIEDARPLDEGQFAVPIVDARRPVPVVFGTVRLTGPNVAWYGGLRTEPIKTKIRNGGLFSKKKHVITGFRYRLGLQFTLCRGELDPDLLQVWIGEHLVYFGAFPDPSIDVDSPRFFGDPSAGGAGGLKGRITAYRGTDDQPANAYLAQFQGGADCPRYVGTAHVVWEGGYLGDSNFIEPWSFVVSNLPNPLGLTQAFVYTGDNISVGDPLAPESFPFVYDPRRKYRAANPANVLYTLYTNSEWGKGLPADRIDIDSFRDEGERLRLEGNGVSMVIDRKVEVDSVRDEILRQIDGSVIDDPITGKIRLKLSRADYVVADLTEVSKETNLQEVTSFGKFTIAGTVNQVRIDFLDCQSWQTQQAPDQDMANAMLQGAVDVSQGTNIEGTFRYPYCNSRTLAKSIATRELRRRAFPLASATLKCSRELWAKQPGDLIALTIPERNLDKLPMRILQVTHAEPNSDYVQLDVVQDLFSFEVAKIGVPVDTGWTIDSSLLPFDRGLIEEAPRAIARRAIEFGDVAPGAMLYTAAKRRSNETGMRILHRENGSGDPFIEHGEVVGHMIVATLTADLGITAIPTSTITVTCDSQDDKDDVLAAFQPADARDAGINLRNLIAIVKGVSPSAPFDNIAQGEFAIVVGGATDGGGLNVVLNTVYRGVFDTAQCGGGGNLFDKYDGGTSKVFLLIGAGTTEDFISVPGNSIDLDVKLVPFSPRGEAVPDSVPSLSFSLYHRTNAPYNPGSLSLNGSAQDTTSISLEGTGSGDGLGIRVQFVRRDYRTSDEVQALETDATVLFDDFPTKNNTLYTIRAQKPGVLPLTYATVGPTTSNDVTITRNAVLRGYAGVVPTDTIIRVFTTHDLEGATIQAPSTTGWKFTVSSALTGQFAFGALDQNVASASYTVAANGAHDFALFSNMTGGNVEYRVDSGGGFGAWLTLIASGNSTGSTAALSIGDLLQIRHTSGTVGFERFIQMSKAAVNLGFGVLFKS